MMVYLPVLGLYWPHFRSTGLYTANVSQRFSHQRKEKLTLLGRATFFENIAELIKNESGLIFGVKLNFF
jgi:hypothetical protein